ncbi:MAG: aldolase/citrate lyase family protein [Alphaproteobacteria bacterium]|nr:aldolase/citrate lyase family protein [Alphaproteobacteria bacterium]
MRENTLRSIWARGETVINGQCGIASSHVAEVMSQQGYDSLLIDMQHAPVNFDALFAMLQAASTTNTIPLVRVTWNDPALIMRALDSGAYGVICPMVNTADECRRFVGACLYAPLGYRSYGPVRGYLYAGPDYYAKANDTILPIAMIETAEAVANLDAILSVPGLAAVYVGPSDLSITYGLAPSTGPHDPAMHAVFDTIVAACRRHGVVPGIHGFDPDYSRARIAQGFQFVTCGVDIDLIYAGAQDHVKRVRA